MNTILKFSSHHNLLTLPGSLIAGIVTYFVMSLFFIPLRITVPEAIVVSVLVFGLTKYYTTDERQLLVEHRSYQLRDNSDHYGFDDWNNISAAQLLFIGIYVTVLIIVGVFPNSDMKIFIPWNELSLTSLIQLGAAAALCFFFPGYAIILVVDKGHRSSLLLRGLLAYIISMFLSGFTGYITASFGFPLSGMTSVLITIYALSLLPFVTVLLWRLTIERKKITKRSFSRIVRKRFSTFFRKMNQRLSVMLIFASLLSQVMLSTYFLYGGIIIGDQWFHHGRSLTLIDGSYSHFAESDMDDVYPPFLSALLAIFFTLSSNTPSVNAYASIALLNIVPVIAFYYFFTRWISGPRARRAATLASVLFMLSAGFGWVYALEIAVDEPLTSPLSALQTLYTASKQTFDIRSPSTFILPSHPDYSTGIQLIVLPIGFVLLGLIKEVTKNRQIMFCATVFAMTTLAILSHDEIYLFIIIASMLPIAFKLSDKQFLYAGFLCSILFTVLLDTVFPGRYSVYEFFGLPLQGLCILFIALMWLLYRSKNLFKKLSIIKISILQKKVPATRLLFVLGIVLVIAAAFLYIFAYIVWGSLSFEEIQLHISTINVPWYLYPFKIGMMGVLGLAFVISCVFRKFEKEVFVFGVISLIALLLGPYYDEHRFSKYVMVGMIGFASILAYALILCINHPHFKYLYTGMLIASIIVLSSFSTLFYVGYHSLTLETERLDLALGRRDFPSLSEMATFSFLQRVRANNAENSNIVTFASEYQKQHGLLGQIQGFSGIPIPLLLKEPLTLNASTLEGLYSHLASSDIRYILLPKKDIHGGRDEGGDFSAILKFAYDHFQKAYEDDSFIITSVPARLTSPSSSGDVALLYDQNGFLSQSASSDKKINLLFDSVSFENINNSEFVIFEKNKKSVILYGDKKSNTLWSNQLQQQDKRTAINYIEGKFRIVGQNNTKLHNDCGLAWNNGEKKYYTYLRDDKLGFTETPSPDNQIVPENRELKWQKWTWYTLKIIFEEDSAKVYVDNSLKLQIPGSFIENNPISKVGIRCSGGIGEFEPIQVGMNPRISNNSFQETYDIFRHFYPLSALALSNLTYDTFLDNDFSAFSKKNVILTHDPSNPEDINTYLEVVKRGGTLIVMNTNDTHAGGFSKLLSLQQGNSTQFDSIALADHYHESTSIHPQVSGFAREIDFKSIPKDESIISYYLRNNQSIAPFAIEKKYDNVGGRIIYVNVAGYFDALSKSPKKYFSSLSNFAELVNISTDKRERSQDMVSGARFIGNLTASGHAVITSSSLLFPDNSTNTYAEEISISNEVEKRNDHEHPVGNVVHKKTPIEDMELYGQYKAVITSDGVIHLPSPYSPSSQFDYVGVSIPIGSNITLQLSKGARVEFESRNQTRQYSFNDNGTIRFQNIQTDTPEVDSVSVLVKKPEFTVTGDVIFEALYRDLGDFYSTKNVFGRPMELSGIKLKAAFDQVDNYDILGKRGKKTNYLTYLKSLHIEENRTQNQIDLRIPGDISDRAKAEGMEIPWKEIITSLSSIVALSILSIGVPLTFLLWQKLTTKSNAKRKFV